MHQRFRARRARGFGDMAGALVLHGFEALLPAWKQNADKVDNRVRAVRRSEQRVGKAHIGLYGVDLPDPSERLEMTRFLVDQYAELAAG